MYSEKVEEREKECDMFIGEATSILVKARKKRAITFTVWKPILEQD